MLLFYVLNKCYFNISEVQLPYIVSGSHNEWNYCCSQFEGSQCHHVGISERWDSKGNSIIYKTAMIFFWSKMYQTQANPNNININVCVCVCVFRSTDIQHTNMCMYFSRLTSSSRVLLEKLIVAKLVKKCIVFYGIRTFIALFTIARHWTLSWARLIQSANSHPVSLRSMLISCQVLLGLPSVPFHSSFLANIIYIYIL
jgi:hypothetical protein